MSLFVCARVISLLTEIGVNSCIFVLNSTPQGGWVFSCSARVISYVTVYSLYHADEGD